jgi:hypothetical protein
MTVETLDPGGDRLRALRFASPALIPVSVSVLPAAWMAHGDRLRAIVERYPGFVADVPSPDEYDRLRDDRPTYEQGRHVDEWGCEWTNIRRGLEGVVSRHPVPTRAHVRRFRPPAVDAGLPHGFMYLRLTYLRGFEAFMIDVAEEPPELGLLIDKVLTYNLRQARRLAHDAGPPPRLIRLGDDLGIQRSLPISPRSWRCWLGPAFAAIFSVFREAGHRVYLHTDGHIVEIVPDLIDAGVNVLNPQVGANGLPALAEACKGRVCVDLDLDRQQFPFWTPAEIDAHVREAVRWLGDPRGGLWLKAEIGPDVPLANVEAIFAALDRHRVAR